MGLEKLYDFEKKYSFLYEIEWNGVPVYTCFRDSVSLILSGEANNNEAEYQVEKGKIYLRRIWDSFWKIRKLKKAKTLIFTSTMFRRDYGRNLAAEYLMDKYPDGVVFEWPSRTDLYDIAYFQDDRKDRYCPLDFYILLYKFYGKLHRKEAVKLENDCREQLKHFFARAKEPENSYEKKLFHYYFVKCRYLMHRLQFLKEYLRNSLRTMIIYNMLLISGGVPEKILFQFFQGNLKQ